MMFHFSLRFHKSAGCLKIKSGSSQRPDTETSRNEIISELLLSGVWLSGVWLSGVLSFVYFHFEIFL